MKRYIFIILLAMMLTGCATSVDYTIYSNGHKITIKMANRTKDYTYWYKLVDQENGNTLGWYSNKNYDVGDVIWMGARWGREMNQNDGD